MEFMSSLNISLFIRAVEGILVLVMRTGFLDPLMEEELPI